MSLLINYRIKTLRTKQPQTSISAPRKTEPGNSFCSESEPSPLFYNGLTVCFETRLALSQRR